MNSQRDKLTFTRLIFEAVKGLPLETQAKIYNASFEYCLNFNEVELSGVEKTVFSLIKPQLDKSNAQYKNGVKSQKPKATKKVVVPKTEKPKFNKATFRKALIDHGADKNHVNDWFVARDKKKGVYTETALKTFINECANNNFLVSDAVKLCAENNWSGFKVQWVKNLQQNNGQQNSNTEPRINRQTASTIQQNSENW